MQNFNFSTVSFDLHALFDVCRWALCCNGMWDPPPILSVRTMSLRTSLCQFDKAIHNNKYCNRIMYFGIRLQPNSVCVCLSLLRTSHPIIYTDLFIFCIKWRLEWEKKCNTSTNQKQKCIIIISDFYQNRFLWRPRQISRCNNFSICVWGGYNTHNKFMLVEDYGQKNARQNLHTAQINPRY